MLPERRRVVAGERRGVVWVVGRSRVNTRRGYLPPRLTCKGSGSKRALIFARFATYRVGAYISVESSPIVQTSAPHPSKEGTGNRRGGVSLEPMRYLSKVRWAQNESSECNSKYSTNLFLKFPGRRTRRGQRREQWLKI